MVKTKKTRKNKQKKDIKVLDEPQELKKAPHTFVIHRGLSCNLRFFSIEISTFSSK